MSARRALALLLACLASICASAKSADDRAVARDSEVVRAIHAQPLNAEVYDLLVARETLRIAGDEATGTALDAYLSRLAIASLAGAVAAPPVATIGELARAGLPTAADKAALAAVVGSTLRATLLRTGQRDFVARMENTSTRPIRQYDVKLALPRTDGGVYAFSCDRLGYVGPAFAPGEARETECRVELDTGGIEDFLAALGAHPGAPLPLAPSSIEFHEPRVTVWKEGAYWAAREDAQSRALLRMRELPCGARGACGDDFGEWLSGRPLLVAVPFGAIAGFLSGALVGRFTRRRWRNALLVSIAAVALTVVAWVASGASDTGLAAVGLLFIAAGMVAAFLIAHWLAAALFARDRGQL